MSIKVRVPQDMTSDIIEMLTDKVEKLKEQLKTIEKKSDDSQYKLSEMKNQLEAYKKENKRLWAMLQHEDENAVHGNVEVNCNDF